MAFSYNYTGNLDLLERPSVAFFASRSVSSKLYERTIQWAEQYCDSNRVIASGFQSPLEKSVFNILLEARHPMIWALGRMLYRRYSPEVQKALDDGRLLVFAVRNTLRTGWHNALVRNYTVASMSDESVYAINTDGRCSSLDVLCQLEEGTKPVYRL